MSRRGARDRFVMAPRHLAGWLFADLFLVLFVIALGMMPAADGKDDKPPERKPDSSPSPSESEKTPEQGPGGIDPRYRSITVKLSGGSTSRASGKGGLSKADADKVREAVRREMGRTAEGRRIGMVITWGLGPQAQLEPATELADRANKALRSGAKEQFCGSNVGMRSLWKGNPRPDAVKIEIYYVNACDDKS
ncbi:hypothetical protein ACWEQ7_30410 [Streptomyces sp. NPDC004069]